MDENVKAAMMECFQDPDFIKCFQENILAPVIKQAVAEAVAQKDQEIRDLRAELLAAKEEIDTLEQYSRRNCLTISGVPETDQECTDKLVVDVAKAAGVSLSPGDIDRSHRIGPVRRGKTRQIIVRFLAFNRRQEVYLARKDFKAGRVKGHPVLTSDVLSGTFIAENLTRKNQRIMYLARQMRRKGKLHSVWTDSCRLKARTHAGGPTSVIRSLSDLRDLVGEDPELLAALQADGPGVAPATPAADAAPAAAAGWTTVGERTGGRGKRDVTRQMRGK